MQPTYIVRMNPSPRIAHESPAIHRPCYLRTYWALYPAHVDAHGARLAEGQRVDALQTIYPDTQRWHITIPSAHGYGNGSIILDTKAEGAHEWMHDIRAPATRTPGVWYSWGTGEWKRHTALTDCHRYILDECWHTPQWRKGQDMTPLPPRDYAHKLKSMEI